MATPPSTLGGALLPADATATTTAAGDGGCAHDDHLSSPDGSVHVVTAVWRAGFAGAPTDHSAVCFGVDVQTGRLVPGTSAAHWYRLGLRHAVRGLLDALPARPLGRGGGGGVARARKDGSGWWSGLVGVGARPAQGPTSGSPDGARWSYVPQTGMVVSGRRFPGWEGACRAAVEAHRALLRDVPLVGWDVAVVDGGGGEDGRSGGKKNRPLLLEANLSLNFFGGACDRAAYASFCLDAFSALARADESAA